MDLKKITSLSAVLIFLVIAGCGTAADESSNPIDHHQNRVNELYATYDQLFLSFLEQIYQETGYEVIRVEPFSECCTVPKRVTIKGSPFEFGSVVGELAVLNNLSTPAVSPGDEVLNQEYISMYRKIYPAYLEILRGIGSAFDLTVDEMDLAYMEYKFFEDLWAGLLKYPDFYNITDFGSYGDIMPDQNCSIASYFTGQRHLVGRNFDNPSDRPHYFADTELDGCNRMMGNVIYFLYHWVVDGINEKGLSINVASNGGDYRLNEQYLGEPSVFAGHMARIVMDTCGTVDEALKKIGSVRVWFPNEGVHWLIADSSGRSVIVEFDHSKKMVVFDRPDPYELITNTAQQMGEGYIMENCWRYSLLKPGLESGISTMSDMHGLMETAHFKDDGLRTLWTSVMDLNGLTFEITYRKEYERIYRFSFTD